MYNILITAKMFLENLHKLVLLKLKIFDIAENVLYNVINVVQSHIIRLKAFCLM